MTTPHNEAQKHEIASIVLMPGDPLRAQYIANTYLENVNQFNDVRNMLGFTGFYKGKEISVMGSGMGMPSIGIYSYELFSHYDVDVIIRVGSAGGYLAKLHAMDIILAKDAYSLSNFAYHQNQTEDKIMKPDPELNEHIKKIAKELNIPLSEVRLYSSDIFYAENEIFREKAKSMGCAAVEMESFALFHNANVLNKKAAALCTISDSFVHDEDISSEDREKSFDEMIVLALEAAITI